MITSIGYDKPPHPKPPEDCTAAKWPLGLSRVEAAQYIGVSPSTFDKMVADGRMPKPISINARKVWYRPSLEQALWAMAVAQNAAGAAANDDENPFDVLLPAAMRR
jgi:predicted DNA-binding transcriptional regulator AlpA